jgi:hypothetical protein
MTESNRVTLRHGLSIPVRAVEVALDLERRGCRLEVDGSDILIGPRDLITDEDRTAVRALKPHLIALVRYVDAPEHEQ